MPLVLFCNLQSGLFPSLCQIMPLYSATQETKGKYLKEAFVIICVTDEKHLICMIVFVIYTYVVFEI